MFPEKKTNLGIHIHPHLSRSPIGPFHLIPPHLTSPHQIAMRTLHFQIITTVHATHPGVQDSRSCVH
ncbi:hypothetical protein BST61_g2821 [Cercospora zeina]